MIVTFADVPPMVAIVSAMLEGLTLSNVAIMRAAGGLPPLYSLGTRYTREPKGSESWKMAHVIAARPDGEYDCEDLAGYRAAELRFGGDLGARAIAVQMSPTTIHCIVIHGNGMIEDPSMILGMGGRT